MIHRFMLLLCNGIVVQYQYVAITSFTYFQNLIPTLERYDWGCKCGGQRGFCGSCFNRGFDEDAWDREDAQRTAAQMEGGSVNGQPRPNVGMATNSPATADNEGEKPRNGVS